MTWWMILLLVAAVLVLIGCIPVGIDAAYDGAARVRVCIGAVHLTLLPPKKKHRRSAKRKQKQENNEPEHEKPEKNKSGFPADAAQLRRLLELALSVLGQLRRKLRVERLELYVHFGGDDPAQAAIRYGQAWAVIGGLTPLLDRLFVIQRRCIEPRYTPGAQTMRVSGCARITMTIGRALALGLRAGFGVLKILIKSRKGVVQHESSSV